ncbi:MAG: outer membrane lipid asymmetry maintenance protein MlaD [Rubellimicrobium sp.]|nr:outer membrane lipid asymmetry maintenance protein MlaD [Rubellimicrobium sp.]
MQQSRSEIAVGAVVLAAAAVFLVWLLQFAGGQTRGGYEVMASFRSAEGVAIGSEVRMSGIRIGTVSGMALNPLTFRAETRLRLDPAVPIPDDSSAVVASDGLMGGAYVEIVAGGSPGNLGPGAEILDTQGAVSLIQLLLKYVSGGSGDSGSSGGDGAAP